MRLFFVGKIIFCTFALEFYNTMKNMKKVLLSFVMIMADTYTLQGVRVQKPVKSGLYIKGNRKIYLQGK